ncbi:MAG: beta-galactosidase, partial [Armatimonadota bacterium]|nr:beta-galactosidase [Armatimonadota bacterium]
AFTTGRHHWTPYRIVGAGRETWLKMWRIYAQRYRNAGAAVLMFELFNEPAYTDWGAQHPREFAAWLRRRHGTLDALNAAWKTSFASWEEAAAIDSEARLKEVPGRFLDYDDYLSERFADLTAAGVAAVQAILPHTLVGVQPMGGYTLEPREAVWKHRLIPHETVVLTPTGGGRWSPGASTARPAASTVAHPMAGAPLEDDLLLALAGNKMLVDNETYLRGQTARDTRNRLWEHVVAGLDGLTVFSWSKRGWSWWKDREALVVEADRFPYSALIPLARRTDALRGIYDFAAEVQPLANRILPKPWGPPPRVGLLFSWPQARRWALEPTARNKTPHYHAALRYGHWNAALLPSDRVAQGALADFDVLIAAGVRVAEPELPARLETFVRGGGVLVLGEEVPGEDLYGRSLDTAERVGVRFGAWEGPYEGEVRWPPTPLTHSIAGVVGRLPDRRVVTVSEGVPLVRTADGYPVVTRRKLGSGLVYAVGADLAGYPLAKLLAAVLEDAAAAQGLPLQRWRAAEVCTPEGLLAPNVLVSRRSYPRHHAVLLLNRDEYPKRVRVQVPGLTGRWRASEGIAKKALPSSRGWYELELDRMAPAVLLLER